MSRLFITPREINFINDVAKELVKDVAGQKIYYFPISEISASEISFLSSSMLL